MVGAPVLPLRLSGACVRRNGKTLVGPVDFDVTASGFTIIMGPNGAGKTTLLRMMHGMERLSAGTLAWQVSEQEARKRQAYVFQTPVMMRRSVLENLTFPLIVHGMSRKAATAEAEKWLDRVNLADASNRPAPYLSGGERQKLALARALVRQPQILFLDEPCANLDGKAVRDIESVLREACAEGTRIIMVTHDIGQAKRLAEDMVFIYRGKVHETNIADHFFRSPQTPETKAYLRGDILE